MSIMIPQLIALWLPLFYAHRSQLGGNLVVRLQQCVNQSPPPPQPVGYGAAPASSAALSLQSQLLLKWIRRLQFKLGQIEVQSSFATQFYTV